MTSWPPFINLKAIDKRVVFALSGAEVRSDDADRQFIPVEADLEIDLVALSRLVWKAHRNKTGRSSDGPLLVRIKPRRSVR